MQPCIIETHVHVWHSDLKQKELDCSHLHAAARSFAVLSQICHKLANRNNRIAASSNGSCSIGSWLPIHDHAGRDSLGLFFTGTPASQSNVADSHAMQLVLKPMQMAVQTAHVAHLISGCQPALPNISGLHTLMLLSHNHSIGVLVNVCSKLAVH